MVISIYKRIGKNIVYQKPSWVKTVRIKFLISKFTFAVLKRYHRERSTNVISLSTIDVAPTCWVSNTLQRMDTYAAPPFCTCLKRQ